MNKDQLVTRYIKHLAESANFKGGTRNKHSNGLTVNRFEMPNVSYSQTISGQLNKGLVLKSKAKPLACKYVN